jgi:D-aminoacyl-tRNA deacylase
MRLVIQRVTEASVKIDQQIKAAIQTGLLILIGIEAEDNYADIEWLVQKVTQMRIFSDQEGKMNLSIQDIHGSFLVISQFTLFASTKKGNRPSYIQSARPEIAIPLYESFIHELQTKSNLEVKSGIFGADMQVSLVNNGPVTITMDSKNRI